MSTPVGENAFLHELEVTVSTELIMAETSQPEEEAVRVPVDEWLFDPAIRRHTNANRWCAGHRTF